MNAKVNGKKGNLQTLESAHAYRKLIIRFPLELRYLYN